MPVRPIWQPDYHKGKNGPKRQDDIKRVPKRHDDITGNYDIRGEKAGDSNRTLRTHGEDGNKQ